MKELEFLELQEVSLQEIISYSKMEHSAFVTILDDLNYGLFNELVVLADQLKFIFFIIKDTRKVAIIGNSSIAEKVARKLQVKYQTMFYRDLRPRKILGKIYTPKTDNHFKVKAYNEKGQEIEPFIDTNIETVECTTLSKFKFGGLRYAMKIRGSGNNKIESLESLKISRRNFLKSGKI